MGVIGSKYYSIFDGRYPELALQEIETLFSALSLPLQREGTFFTPELFVWSGKSPYNSLLPKFQRFSKLVAMTKVLGRVLFTCTLPRRDSPEDVLSEVLHHISLVEFQSLLSRGHPFKVLVTKKGDLKGTPFSTKTVRTSLMLGIAEIIGEKTGCQVDLSFPIYEIDLILSPAHVLIGLRLFEPNRKAIELRSPAHRIFFHTASMKPLMVRCMVNLGATKHNLPEKSTKKDLLFLDPFVGGAGMLVEAGEQGYSLIGVDVGYWMCRGSRMNLKDYQLQTEEALEWSLLRSGSEQLPIVSSSVDLIVTDPPYGTSTILGGWNLAELLEKVLHECNRILKPNARLIITIPSHTPLDFDPLGFRVLHKVEDRVHRSLTRVIWTLERKASLSSN